MRKRLRSHAVAALLLVVVAALLAACSTAPAVRGQTARIPPVAEWAGTWTGTLPCADCPGIAVTLRLLPDARYWLRWQYLERGPGPVQQGTITWLNADTLHLGGVHDGAADYRLGADGSLTQLGMHGRPIGGPLAARFVLRRLPALAAALAAHTWRLTRLDGVALPTDLPARAQPTLAFDAGAARVAGSDGCNRLAGAYRLTGADALHITQLVSTRMACLQGAALAERYRRALEQTRAVHADTAQLLLLDAQGAVLAQFAR